MVSAAQLVEGESEAIRWVPLDESPSAAQIKQHIKTIGGAQDGEGGISDPLPVITRFYFEKREE